MVTSKPVTTLSAFSSTDAVPTAWVRGKAELRDAEVYWLSTVRPDGRPHVTPLLGIWLGPVRRHDRPPMISSTAWGSRVWKSKSFAQVGTMEIRAMSA